MPRDRRAIVFDLDDTLYPYRQFRASGFAAVARHLNRAHGCNVRSTLAQLLRSSRGADRGRELQACLARHGLPAMALDELLDLVRHHEPTLRLPAVTATMLARLRADGWRLGVLTNGDAAVQRRKVAALAIGPAVEAIVYATECGQGAGKPDPEPFREIARQLGVRAHRTVFVGNDERCDVAGARGASMLAVLCAAWTRPAGPTLAHHVIGNLAELPAVARALLEGAKSHAA
jgi:putative hydrolase of the HAD superfamily